MKSNIEVLEFDTVGEAEAEFFKRHNEGTWVVVDRLKVVWSWKKFKSVCKFSMKKVEQRPMDIQEFLITEIPKLSEAFAVISEAKKRRRERNALIAITENSHQNSQEAQI